MSQWNLDLYLKLQNIHYKICYQAKILFLWNFCATKNLALYGIRGHNGCVSVWICAIPCGQHQWRAASLVPVLRIRTMTEQQLNNIFMTCGVCVWVDEGLKHNIKYEHNKCYIHTYVYACKILEQFSYLVSVNMHVYYKNLCYLKGSDILTVATSLS